jgi:tetratricopeptide (TPR) repeat protein
VNEAIRLQPRYAQAFNDLGFIYRDMGRYEEALAEFTRAASLDALYTSHGDLEIARVHANQAATLYLMRRDAEAEREAEDAIRRGFDPGQLDDLMAYVRGLPGESACR